MSKTQEDVDNNPRTKDHHSRSGFSPMNYGLKLMPLMMRRFSAAAVLLCMSCSYFQKPDIIVDPNVWTGKTIYFVDLDDAYKRTTNFNQIWSKLNSRRFRPYHRFQNKQYTIVGAYETFDYDFLVIEDKKGRRYKMVFSLDMNEPDEMPSYILFDDVLKEAKTIIGKTIWLNDTYDPRGFYTFSDYAFPRFDPVTVEDVFHYQNSDFDYPVWLKVQARTGDEAFVRYNGEEGRVGTPDHYYTSEPLPSSWGKKMIRKVLAQKIELGMIDRQVRISIGNPDEVHTTSSRHGIGEQWIYARDQGKKIYYQFEYGKLTYINK